MLKVRFPNGQCIIYNDANVCIQNNTCHTLYTDYDKTDWVANIPINCIIEAVDPCKIENSIIKITLDKAFNMVEKALEEKITDYNLAYIKKLLKDYNAFKCEWK